ncbi:GspE/PulE family protein [Thioalkalivibrio sp. ALE16]|uniref:GspE/PulE family protein n=1 Tax=Thioalkalivibrio sp. ALE16 TaxID=1158172 RepID=UPI00035D7FED|nr:ATPase, T2SS/T4P/T4SS family [Thioalkalivibrio sp. ALE16]
MSLEFEETAESVGEILEDAAVDTEGAEQPAPPSSVGAIASDNHRERFEAPEITRMVDLPPYDWILTGSSGVVKAPLVIEDFACVVGHVTHIKGDFQKEDIEVQDVPRMVESQSIELEVWVLCTGRVRDRSKVHLADLIGTARKALPGARVHNRPRLTTAAIIEALYERQNSDELLSGGDVSNEQQDFDDIGRYALANKVSDIHIEADRESAQILMRQHGRLRHYKDLAPERARAICSAAYNTLTESGSTRDSFNERIFQNAVIDRPYEEGRVRFRYASMPVAPEGFNVVLRLLPIGVEADHQSYEDLGYAESHVRDIRRAMGKSSGVFIIAGTTGSGKSTTLQNAIEGIAMERPDQKIRTIEEPVEYRIRGASQTPVVRDESKAGDGKSENKPFVDAIKAALRSDPDVLMIGEIRDTVTAELAIQAAQTGHQVATTIHADAWSGVVDRLNLIDIDGGTLSQPGLISGLAYQKLMPVLCDHCKIPAEEWARENAGTPEQKSMIGRLSEIQNNDLDGIYFSKQNGCPECNGVGIVGQTVCAEVALPNNAMLRAIRQGDIIEARKAWRDQRSEEPGDMTGRTAFEHAIYKMRKGICDPRDIEHRFMMLDELFHLDD